jgi:uncharacterized membrane protein YdjX (TVP38/TMEM64 family)
MKHSKLKNTSDIDYIINFIKSNRWSQIILLIILFGFISDITNFSLTLGGIKLINTNFSTLFEMSIIVSLIGYSYKYIAKKYNEFQEYIYKVTTFVYGKRVRESDINERYYVSKSIEKPKKIKYIRSITEFFYY